MGNHFHLVLYCPDPILSAAMRDLKSRYAKSFHKAHNSSGPLFEAPFVEVPILDDEHLMVEVRYAHRNPLDLDPNACLASAPWSSHGIYLGLRPRPTWMQTRVVLHLFGPTYRRDVESPRDSDKVHNIVSPIVATPGDATIGAASDWSLSRIRRAVAAAADCDLVEVRPRTHNGLNGLAAVLAMDVAGFNASEIADPCGFKSAGAVRMAAHRTRTRLKNDPGLARTHREALARLQPQFE